MSKPRNYWYSIARQMAQRYKKLDCSIKQEQLYKTAIEQALEEVAKKADATERLEVIRTVIFNANMNCSGAAMRVHVSECTAQRWMNDFINQVGINAGYADKKHLRT